MGELKPLGSEKLSGDDKLKRILELTYYQSPTSEKPSSEIVKESKTGVYGIVKERDWYYVKKGLTEDSLDYIGGLFMKNKNRFSSHGEALKKLEFLTEQELAEATKYVLKKNKPEPKPQEEAPAPMPTTDVAPPPPAPDAGMGIPPEGEIPPPEGDIAGEEPAGDPNDYMKVIQKMAGRLTQKMGVYKDQLESKDLKWILKMVIAAVDLDKMDEADLEEILSEFEDEEDMVEPTSDFPTDANGETPAPQNETDDVDGIAKLDELINTSFDDEEFGYEGDDDEYGLNDDDIDFLNNPELKKAGRVASKDIGRELGAEDPEDMGLSSDDEDIPLYTDDDEEVDEQGISDIGQMPSGVLESDPTEDEVKELDIDELTSMINDNVKQSLSKYFN